MKFSFPPESKPLDGYTIKRAIHRGGFGEVYYALSDAGKEVALKLLHTNLDVELRGVNQCLNLNHPNLVSIFDVREDRDGDSWIIMEYVPGPSLDRMIDMNRGGMQLDDIEHWLKGIAAGLSFLHDRGIVHRDLKPANVYSEGQQIKLGDVGLSKFIAESRRSAQTQSVGTVYYMAPEVAKGRYGREVDIYAFGIVLYEMLTGTVPFDGETTAEILMKHLSEKPNLELIPKPLRPLIARTLDKDPANRPSDAMDVANGFSQVRKAVGDRLLNNPIVASTPRMKDPSREVTIVRPKAAAAAQAARVAQAAPATAPVPSSSFMTEFQKIPAPIRWIGGGTLFLMLASSGGHSARLLIGGAFLGGIGYVIYSVFQRITGRHHRRAVTEPAAPRPDVQQVFQQFEAQREELRQKKRPAAFDREVPPIVPGKRTRTKTKPAKFSPQTARSISFRQRMTELTGSMTIAVLSTALLTGGLFMLTDFLKNPAAVALFGVTTLISSWAILVPSKLVEGRPSDGHLRRVMFLGIGCAVGAVAFGLDQFLLMNLASSQELGPDPLFAAVGRHPLLLANQPTIAAYLVFFSLLFGLRRWWWHADGFRRSRFRVSTSLFTLGVGWILTAVFAFPNMWGLMWALAISSVVQLSSTWIPHENRMAIVARSTGE